MTAWLANALEKIMDFSNILNASIAASWMVVAVIVIRFLLKKAPKWTHVALWGLVAVRLLLPFSIESAFSLIPSTQTVPQEVLRYEGTRLFEPAHLDVISNPIFSGDVSIELGQTVDRVQVRMVDMSFVWLAGIAILILYTAISYWRLRRKVDTAVLYKDNIFQSENVSSPFVLGVIKPKIYLPFKMNCQDLEHVVAHEQAHIHRKDHWWKPLGFLLLTIHWFNPLMWLAYVFLCRDIELACDEKVIRDLGNDQRADYTQALVACSVNRRMIAACPLAFGEVGVKERVKSVMNYKKPSFWIIVLALIACVVIAVCFLTNPMGFQFAEANHTIASATYFDFRGGEEGSTALNSAQISELSSRLSGVKNAKSGEKYAGLTPGYQISALLEDGSYILISGYSLSENDMVDIEWNGKRYVVADSDFQDYLSRICAGDDVATAKSTLSLNDVIILSQKGYDLTWDDFEQFQYIETGFGLYIRRYEINEQFHFAIGGAGPNSEPMYMYLGANGDDSDARIDIRDGGVTEFISGLYSGVR